MTVSSRLYGISSSDMVWFGLGLGKSCFVLLILFGLVGFCFVLLAPFGLVGSVWLWLTLVVDLALCLLVLGAKHESSVGSGG